MRIQMNIVILNGSPKGEHSITLKYVLYLQNQYPMHDYQVLHVACDINKIEKNKDRFDEIIQQIQAADVVIWSFGLWVLAVSAQYMRFIELVTELNADVAFQGKYTAAISTSINYFDHTAHNFMRGVCEDLGMCYVDGILFDIMDLKDSDKRCKLNAFAGSVLLAAEQGMATSRQYYPLIAESFSYHPGPVTNTVDSSDKRVLILTDKYSEMGNLRRMIDRFRQSLNGSVELIDLNTIDIKGGCTGCMKCGYDYVCQYKDGFRDFYNEQVRAADLIIMAGEMKGRYLSSLWKTFFDRAFFWNHTPSLERKQMAYLISGPISQNQNLIQILEASVTARQNANFVDIISDECCSSRQLDALLDGLADRMIRLSVGDVVKPQNFLAIGGHKIFRDNIWGRLRGIWQADHRFYQRNGYYDFPQYDFRIRVMGMVLIALTKIPRFRKAFYSNVKRMPSIRLTRLVEKLNVSRLQERT